MALERATANSMKHWTRFNLARVGTVLLGMCLAATAVAEQAPKPPAAPSSPSSPSRASASTKSSTSAASAKSDDEEPLPKPGPRGPAEKAELSLPPFLGFFGPASLINEAGFRGTVGSWVEYQTQPTASGGGVTSTMRIQQVGPPVRGGRWLEIIITEGPGKSAAVRLLTRGEEEDNLERLIVQAPGFPPIEMPIHSAQLDWVAPGSPGAKDPSRAAEMGELVHIGREEIEVPLGRFVAEHWKLSAGNDSLDFWLTDDPRVPFTGMVRLGRSDGDFVAVKVGTDATAQVVVPGR